MEHDGHGSQRGFDEEKLESATTVAIASRMNFLKLDTSSSLVRGWYMYLHTPFIIHHH